MILSIDIGGTFLKTGIFDYKKKEFLTIKKYPTIIEKNSFLNALKKIIKEYLINFKFNKIGIGFPGNILNTGEIIFSPNLPFLKQENIFKLIPEMNDFIVKFENDANCAAIGALHYYKKFSDITTITLGTGIGGGIILNKKILKNSRDIGFEIGHITVVPNGEKCSCGKRGCLEAYSSSTGMLKRFNDNSIDNFEKLFKLSLNGNSRATNIIKDGFYFLGIGTGNLINIFAPEIVVFTGGISNVFDNFKDVFFKSLKYFTLDFLFEKVSIKINNKTNLGLLGAANLFN